MFSMLRKPLRDTGAIAASDLLTTHVRPSLLAIAGTSWGAPALHATHHTRPAREAGRKEQN